MRVIVTFFLGVLVVILAGAVLGVIPFDFSASEERHVAAGAFALSGDCRYSYYHDDYLCATEEPWYVSSFPGFGEMAQRIIPGARGAAAPSPVAPPLAPAPTPVESAPRQYAQPSCWISARPSALGEGGSAALLWESYHAARAVLSGIGEVPTGGVREVSPRLGAHTYTLRVVGAGGEGSCYAHVQVGDLVAPPACIISAHPVSIQAGGSTSLAWHSVNATSARLSRLGAVALRGGTFVTPTETTTYGLTVRDTAGRPGTCAASVVVVP